VKAERNSPLASPAATIKIEKQTLKKLQMSVNSILQSIISFDIQDATLYINNQEEVLKNGLIRQAVIKNFQ